jgi:hypothetical protein
MKISYAITVCNEQDEIKRLLNFLIQHKRKQDEICVLLDKPKASHVLVDSLYWYSSNDLILLKESKFNNNFADWKNEMNKMCDGDYIVNFDADEIPNENLIKLFPEIIENNSEVDLVWLPRINTLNGNNKDIKEYINSQKWTINEKGWINWPNDYQGRLYKNSPEINWEGNVHERIIGFKKYALLPSEEIYSIYHPKTLEKQMLQNKLYNEI